MTPRRAPTNGDLDTERSGNGVEPKPLRPSVDPVRFLTRSVLPWVIMATLVGRVLANAAMPLSNTDTFFHLRFGAQFLDGTWKPWHTGHLTTFESAHWAPTEWLSEVIMAAAERAFGLAGVAWLAGLLYVGLVAIWFLIARRYTEPLAAAMITALALMASAGFVSMRPQVVSFLLITVTTEAWLRSVESRRPPWWLVPVMWFWAMLHGMWPIGILIGLAAVVAAAAINGRRSAMALLPVPVAQAVVAACTPVGPRLYHAVLQVDSRGKYFTEWGPPDFKTVYGAAMLILLAIAVIAVARSRRIDPLTVLLVVGALAAAVYSQRTVPAAAALLVPVLARLTGPQRDVTVPGSPPRRPRTSLLLGVAALGLAVLALVVPHTADSPGVAPTWLDSALSKLPAGTVVDDNSGIGGYLLWAHPQLDLLAHGYGDVYTDAEIQRIGNIALLGPGWDANLKATGATYAVQHSGSAVVYALTGRGWEVVGSADGWALLRAPAHWLDTAQTAGTLR